MTPGRRARQRVHAQQRAALVEPDRLLPGPASAKQYSYEFDPQFYYNTAAQTLQTDDSAPYGVAGPIDILYRAGDLGPRRVQVKSDETRACWPASRARSAAGTSTAPSARCRAKVTVDQYGSILITPMEDALASGTCVPGMVNSPAVLAQISPVLSRKGQGHDDFRRRPRHDRIRLAHAAGRRGRLRCRRGSAARDAEGRVRRSLRHRRGVRLRFAGSRWTPSARSNRPTPSSTCRCSRAWRTQLALPPRPLQRRRQFDDAEGRPEVDGAVPPGAARHVRAASAWPIRARPARRSASASSTAWDPVRCPVIDATNPTAASASRPTCRATRTSSPKSRATLGLVFEPAKDVSISIDRWRINRTNEITNLDITYLLANQAAYAGYIRRDGTSSITDVDLPYLNWPARACRAGTSTSAASPTSAKRAS